MRSASGLYIDWVKPDLEAEWWEFSHHPAKQPYYREHALSWEMLLTANETGRLTPWPRAPHLDTVPIQLSYFSYDDYLTYLAKSRRNYRLNYNRMEASLQREGSLTLPAPIVLISNGDGLLFAGWRRLCLAWNYGMVPCVWVLSFGNPTASLQQALINGS